jgi:membrane-bound serine protease (ClpP class)
MIPFVLLAVGVLSIFLEFYTPGGLFAVIGVLFLLSALVVFLGTNPTAIGVVSFVALMIASLTVVIWWALRRIRRSATRNTFYLNEDQEGFISTTFDRSLIGKQGMTVSDLGPSGFVLIEGKRYQASCRNAYIDKGTPIIVVGGEGGCLIVKVGD